mmetsp:Transcript_33086/g.79042  ORF Transcript_33086/g.79042 Transcript_33086/m.79042 type:complete len:223 (-) Transcript_33086:747-1415(-)
MRTSVSLDVSTIELIPFQPWARRALLNARTSAAEMRNEMRSARMVRLADSCRRWTYSSVTVGAGGFSGPSSVAGTASSATWASCTWASPTPSSAASDLLRPVTPPMTTFPALLTLSATAPSPFLLRSSSLSRLPLVGRTTGFPAHQPQKTWRKQHPPLAIMESRRTAHQQPRSAPPPASPSSASSSPAGSPLPRRRRPGSQSLKQQSVLPTLRRSSHTPQRT